MGLRILIVDDSPVMRKFILRVMELSGLDVACCTQAENGESALRALKNQRADIILTDINMPGMDGEELVRRLQADPAFRALPVVVVSTDATSCRIQRMLKLGARGYVTKPFSPEALRQELDRVLETTNV